MGALLGFLFGRLLVGTTIGQTFLKTLAFMLALGLLAEAAGAILRNAHVHAATAHLYAGVAVVVALALFLRAYKRGATPSALLPFVLGIMVLALAAGTMMHVAP